MPHQRLGQQSARRVADRVVAHVDVHQRAAAGDGGGDSGAACLADAASENEGGASGTHSCNGCIVHA